MICIIGNYNQTLVSRVVRCWLPRPCLNFALKWERSPKCHLCLSIEGTHKLSMYLKYLPDATYRERKYPLSSGRKKKVNLLGTTFAEFLSKRQKGGIILKSYL